MPTIVVRTIGAGGDFATPQAWNDGAPADLVAVDQVWEGRILAGNNFFSDSTIVTVVGSNSDATRYKHLTTAPGASFQDHSTASTNPIGVSLTIGVVLTITSEYLEAGAVYLAEPYSKISKIQIYASAATINGSAAIKLDPYTIADQCMFLGYGDGNNNVATVMMHTATIRNSLIVVGAPRDTLIVIGGGNQSAFENCTFGTLGGVSNKAVRAAGTLVFYNCAVFGFENVLFGAATISGSNNFTEIQSPPAGFTAIASFAAAGFTDPGNNNWRITTSSPLKNAGLANSNCPTDIMGTSRPQGLNYDVGAHEFVVEGPSAVVPGAPLNVVITDNGNSTINVAFGAPTSDGGAVITRYDALSSVGGVTVFGAGSPLTLSGVSLTAQTVTVTATNSAGNGPASAASNSVTPTNTAGSNVVQTKLAPFIGGDVLTAVAAQAFKYLTGAMVAVGLSPAINIVANVPNGRQALLSVPGMSDGGFHGVVRWTTGTQYFAEELYIAPTVIQATYTVAKVCNLPQGTDISGVIGYQIRNGANAAISARITAGIYATPLVTGPDKFCAEITIAPGSYFLVWDNGAGVYSHDEMLVLGAQGTSGSGGTSVIPANPGAPGSLTFPAFKISSGQPQALLAIAEMKIITIGGIVVATLTGLTTNSSGTVIATHANVIIGTTYFVWGYTAAGAYFHNLLVAT